MVHGTWKKIWSSFKTKKKRFWPLQGMLHGAMIRETCLAMALRDKLHEKMAHRNSAFTFNAFLTVIFRFAFGLLTVAAIS